MSLHTSTSTETKRKLKQKLIMDVALRLFANEGYHATSIAKISRQANISKGLLYNYFESKEDLFRSIMASHSHLMHGLFAPNHKNELTNADVMAFFDHLFMMIKQKREELKFYFQMMMQPQVLDIYLQGNPTSYTDQGSDYFTDQITKSLLTFFSKQSDVPPMIQMLDWTSTIKGFVMQYVFAPELFSNNMLDEYKAYLKTKFITPS